MVRTANRQPYGVGSVAMTARRGKRTCSTAWRFTFLRFFVEDELVGGDLMEVLPDHRLPVLIMYVVFPIRRHRLHKLRSVADFLAEQSGR